MTWLRYYYQPSIQAVAVAALCFGGLALWIVPTLVFLINGIADEVAPDFVGVEQDMPFEDGPLFLSSALMLVVITLWVAMVAMSLGATPAQAHLLSSFVEPQPLWVLLGGVIGVGMLIAAAANVAHEFCHRLHSPVQRFLGQVLLALALHPSLPIEHVFGHHRNVGTRDDPATAQRSEGFWRYFLRSACGTFVNAHRFEKRRLRDRRLAARLAYNRTYQGYGVLAAWWLSALALGGIPGLLGFVLVGLVGMVNVELFQYISHYGLVRVPGTPVRADHSWEWSRVATSSFMLNLSRHGAHHLNGTKSYWQLNFSVQSPTYPLGPNLMAFAALFPPVFHQIAKPALADWDRRFATAAEKAYAAETSQLSARHRRHVESQT